MLLCKAGKEGAERVGMFGPRFLSIRILASAARTLFFLKIRSISALTLHDEKIAFHHREGNADEHGEFCFRHRRTWICLVIQGLPWELSSGFFMK
jgi:hypothetical protein